MRACKVSLPVRRGSRRVCCCEQLRSARRGFPACWHIQGAAFPSAACRGNAGAAVVSRGESSSVCHGGLLARALATEDRPRLCGRVVEPPDHPQCSCGHDDGAVPHVHGARPRWPFELEGRVGRGASGPRGRRGQHRWARCAAPPPATSADPSGPGDGPWCRSSGDHGERTADALIRLVRRRAGRGSPEALHHAHWPTFRWTVCPREGAAHSQPEGLEEASMQRSDATPNESRSAVGGDDVARQPPRPQRGSRPPRGGCHASRPATSARVMPPEVTRFGTVPQVRQR